MVATGAFVDHRGHAIKINPILLPVCCPRFLKRAGLLARGDPKSGERQDHRANTDLRRRALANISALPAPENCKGGCAGRTQFVAASRPDHRVTR